MFGLFAKLVVILVVMNVASWVLTRARVSIIVMAADQKLRLRKLMKKKIIVLVGMQTFFENYY